LAARRDLGLGEVPSVAMNERGTIVVVYQDAHRIKAIRRPAGGTWQRPRTLVTTRGLIAAPVAALGPGGGATVVVGKDINNNLDLTMVAIRSRSGGGWGRPHRLGLGDLPAVVTGPRGWVTAAWSCQQESVCVAEHGSTGWRPRRRMLRGSSASPEIAVDGTGRVYMATSGAVLSHRPAHRWRREPAVPDGVWHFATIAAAGRGRAAVVFTGPGTSGDREVVAAARRRSGAWSPPHLISDRHSVGRVAVAGNGTAFVAVSEAFDNSDVAVARFAPGRGWRPPVRLGRGTEGTVVCGPDGNATALFSNSNFHLKAFYRPSG
jgi:hypothetical protein